MIIVSKIKFFLILHLMLFFALNIVNGQSLEQILENHYQASGISNYKDVQSIKYNATRTNHYLKHISQNPSELTSKVVISVSRDNEYLLQNFGSMGEDDYSYSNGNYWRDTPSPEPRQEFSPGRYYELEIKLQLDFEGFLFDWKKKGYQVVKLDDVRLSQKNYHRIKLVTPQKDILFYYINPSSYLIDKISFQDDLADGKEHLSVTFSEYKKVNGIQMAYKRLWRTHSMDGKWGDKEIKINSIDLNPKFDKQIFTLEKKGNQ